MNIVKFFEGLKKFGINFNLNMKDSGITIDGNGISAKLSPTAMQDAADSIKTMVNNKKISDTNTNDIDTINFVNMVQNNINIEESNTSRKLPTNSLPERTMLLPNEDIERYKQFLEYQEKMKLQMLQNETVNISESETNTKS